MCYSALVKKDLQDLLQGYQAGLVAEHFQAYEKDHQVDPKRFPKLRSRIFPGHYASVIYVSGIERKVSPMRYGAYPPPMVMSPKSYTTFNARRDNLKSPFWSNAFMCHHGFIVLKAFYEWVLVTDVLKAGAVTLSQVKEVFAREVEERKAKILAAGKKYKMTPTELKDPRERQIIIEFSPEDGEDLLAPVIFSLSPVETSQGKRLDMGFAIVTDEPQPEIQRAGHDRCPVILAKKVLDEWLSPQRATPGELVKVLGVRQHVTFRHQLPVVA